MAKEIQEIEKPMDLIRFNLERQQEQGRNMLQILNEVQSLKNDTQNIKNDVDEKFTEMSLMVKEVKDSVTLTYEEQKELQSTVFSLSNNLAKEYFNGEEVSRDDFSKQVGKFRRSIWKKLKELMNVPRYSSIRRVDYKDSIDFVKSLRMKDFLEV